MTFSIYSTKRLPITKRKWSSSYFPRTPHEQCDFHIFSFCDCCCIVIVLLSCVSSIVSQRMYIVQSARPTWYSRKKKALIYWIFIWTTMFAYEHENKLYHLSRPSTWIVQQSTCRLLNTLHELIDVLPYCIF